MFTYIIQLHTIYEVKLLVLFCSLCLNICPCFNCIQSFITLLLFYYYFMFYQITHLLAGNPSFRIDLSKKAKETVSELLMVNYLLHFWIMDNRVVQGIENVIHICLQGDLCHRTNLNLIHTVLYITFVN